MIAAGTISPGHFLLQHLLGAIIEVRFGRPQNFPLLRQKSIELGAWSIIS